jgi:hypothetical protein
MKTTTTSPPPRSSSFSLAALLFLLACAAVLLAILLPALQTQAEQQLGGITLVGTAAAVGLLASVLGGLIGLFHYRRLRGLGWGILTGLLTGICIGPVVLSDHYGQVVATCLGGSVFLVTLAIFYRLQES